MSFGHLLFKKRELWEIFLFQNTYFLQSDENSTPKNSLICVQLQCAIFLSKPKPLSFFPLNLATSFSHNNLDFEGISCTTSCPHKLHDCEPMLVFMNGDVWMYKYPGAYSKEFGELLPISFSLSQSLEQEQCKLAHGLHASFQIQTNKYQMPLFH